MKTSYLSLFALSIFAASATAKQDDQAQLDAACEDARQQKIIPKRQELISNCQKKDKNGIGECESEFSNYGARQGKRAPLYYDLPECKKAAAHQSSYRQAK
jgi:hypothetical protein